MGLLHHHQSPLVTANQRLRRGIIPADPTQIKTAGYGHEDNNNAK